MGRRVVSAVLAIVMLASLCFTCAGTVFAAKDPVDEFAASFESAVKKGSTSATIRSSATDVNALLDDVFLRYPVLYHYYGGASWMAYSNYSDITVTFKNLNDDFSDIWVADSLEEFAYYFRKGIELGKQKIYVNVPSTDVEDTLSRVFTCYPILYHYYAGSSWMAYQTRAEITMELKNLQDNIMDIPVIDSDEELFAVMGHALANLHQDIRFMTCNGYDMTNEALDRVFTRMRYEYHLAYMGHFSWSSSYYSEEKAGIQDWTFSFNYFYDLDPGTIQAWRDQTEQVALYLAGSLFAQDMPDYLKVLRIHDWLVNNSRYNIENMDEPGNHLAYGPMAKGSSVCMGYAEAANLLFQAAGIETRYVTGDGINSNGERESHAWNAVKLGGEWYMLDITWDDPVTNDGSNVLRYDYFNVTSTQLAKDHVWDWSAAPECNGTVYNAEYVLQLAENDYNTYLDYDASKLMTQEKARQHFASLIAGIPVILPKEPVKPEKTDTPPVEPNTQPQNQNSSPNQSQNAVQPGNNTGTATSKGISRMWILTAGAVAVLAGGGGAAAYIVMRKEKENAAMRRAKLTGYRAERNVSAYAQENGNVRGRDYGTPGSPGSGSARNSGASASGSAGYSRRGGDYRSDYTSSRRGEDSSANRYSASPSGRGAENPSSRNTTSDFRRGS